MELQKIFKELTDIRLCKNAYDFSKNYLGKSQSYYSVLTANRAQPSIGTLAILEVALKEKASDYENDSYEIFRLRRKQLLSLSSSVSTMLGQRCIDVLNKDDCETVL